MGSTPCCMSNSFEVPDVTIENKIIKTKQNISTSNTVHSHSNINETDIINKNNSFIETFSCKNIHESIMKKFDETILHNEFELETQSPHQSNEIIQKLEKFENNYYNNQSNNSSTQSNTFNHISNQNSKFSSKVSTFKSTSNKDELHSQYLENKESAHNTIKKIKSSNTQKKHDKKNKIELNVLEEKVNLIKKDEHINILLLGPSGVGTSSFIYKATKGKFSQAYIPTISLEKESKEFTVNNSTRIFNLYTIPTDDSYKRNFDFLYSKIHFVLFIYDITIEDSFNSMCSIFYNHANITAGYLGKEKNPNFYIIGNKIDKTPRKDSLSKVEKFCKKYNCTFTDISVKTGRGMKAVINNIIDKFESIKNQK